MKKRPVTPRTRKEQKQATREALIRAATALVAERGLDAPSLDDICARAGYTRGAFYVHFRDRDDLLTAVMDRAGGEVLDALLGAAEQEADLTQVASRFLAALADGRYPLTRKGGVRPYQLLDACARSPRIRRSYRALVEDAIARLMRSIAQGQERRVLRDDVTPSQVSLLLMTIVIGAQTLLDLDMPIDLASGGQAVLTLLARRAPAHR